jgi:hypothetical protein
MADAPQCDECQAILDEFREALSEMPLQVKDQLWSDREAFLKIIGGTEEDVERLEEADGKFRFPFQRSGRHVLPEGRYPKIQHIFEKMTLHRFRTGHSRLFKQLFGK